MEGCRIRGRVPTNRYKSNIKKKKIPKQILNDFLNWLDLWPTTQNKTSKVRIRDP